MPRELAAIHTSNSDRGASCRIKAKGKDSLLEVTASVGVVSAAPGLSIQPSSMISAADENLYEAKRRGRDQVVASLLK